MSDTKTITDPSARVFKFFAHFKSGETEPFAIFREDAADHAASLRTLLPSAQIVDVVPAESVTVNLSPSATEHLKTLHEARNPPSAAVSVDDFAKAEIRNNLTQERNKTKLTAEVEKELDASDAEKKKLEAKEHKPAGPAKH